MAKILGSKSIAELEAVQWPKPGPDVSPLFVRCYELRKQPLSELTVADWRVLIGQDVGLEHLMPMALDVVEKDPLIKTEHYRGDLLTVILQASSEFFRKRPEIRSRVEEILKFLPSALESLEFIEFDTSSEALEEAIAEFQRDNRQA
jgi:hypothetical protein